MKRVQISPSNKDSKDADEGQDEATDDDAEEKMRKAPSLFTSRFAQQMVEARSMKDDHGMLWTVCVFAAAAECFNTLITSDGAVVIRGHELTGTFCNLSGAWLCGFASSLAVIGPNLQFLSDAFRGGFVAAYTSFCHMVEKSVEMHCGKSNNVLPYFTSAIIGGPLLFDIGRRMGAFTANSIGAQSGGSKKPAKSVSVNARYLVATLIVGAIALENSRNGNAAALKLIVGVILTVAACIAGDAVGLIVANIGPDSQVNWGTIAANMAALLLVWLCQALVNLPEDDMKTSVGWTLAIVMGKFRSSFCGALSGYGAFSEDAAGKLVERDLDAAAANIGMNAVTAIVFVTALSHATCPFQVL